MKKKKNKTARTVKIVIFTVLVLPLLLLIILVVFRNPIVERVAEKYLSDVNRAPVEIDALKIALFKPSITIREVRVESAKKPQVYTVKTGLIYIGLRVRPYIKEELVSLPQVILDEIQFNVPNPRGASAATAPPSQGDTADASAPSTPQSESEGASSSSSANTQNKLLALVSTIDTDAVISEYTNDISTFSQLQDITQDVDTLQSDAATTIETVEQNIVFMESKYNEISRSLQDGTEDLSAAQDVVTQIFPLVNQGQVAMDEISSVKERAEYYVQQVKDYSSSLPQSIKKDTDYITDKIADPTLLALDVVIRIVEDLVSEKIAPYQTQLAMALEFLVDYRDAHIANKEGKSEDAPKEDAFDFQIGSLRISIGLAANPTFTLEATNVTDRIYTSSTPTAFNVVASHDVFRIEGDGTISLYPQAPTMLTAALRYSGIPTHIEQLDFIELSSIDSTLDGEVQLTLATTDTGTAGIGFVVKDTDATPVKNAQYGPYVADAIQTASPFDIHSTVDFVDGKIDGISVESEFFQRITEIIAQILLAQMDAVLSELKEALAQEIYAHIEPTLAQANISVEDVDTELLSEIKNLEEVNKKINGLFSDANAQVGDMIQEKVKEEQEKLKKQVESEAKKGIEQLKKSLPF